MALGSRPADLLVAAFGGRPRPWMAVGASCRTDPGAQRQAVCDIARGTRDSLNRNSATAISMSKRSAAMSGAEGTTDTHRAPPEGPHD